ncbi:hypothetical protein EHM76_05950 [bacterium]|nr:MAG: hypothetical protein EHM76_05950 [bacterium]
MDKKNTLLGLLEKKNLDNDEKELLKSLLNDEELKSFYDIYFNTESAFKKGEHISIDDLRDYILIKNNLSPENEGIYNKITIIEDHLRSCSECTEEFAFLNSEFNDIENHVAKDFKKRQESVFTPFLTSKFYWSRYVVTLIAIAAFIYLIAFSLSEFTTPAAYKYAFKINEEYYVTRGRATDEFQRSTAAFEEKNYEKAISSLEKDITAHPDDATIFYSYYILGITYLQASGKDYLGLFPSYDTEMVNKGITYLNSSLEKNSSGNFENITFDIYYQLGRAHLMLNNIDSARHFFSLVIEKKGSRMLEAEEILKGLEG